MRALLSESAGPGFGMKGRKTPDASQAPSPGRSRAWWWSRLGVRASDLEPIHSLCQSTAEQANSCSEHLCHLHEACRHYGVSEGSALQTAPRHRHGPRSGNPGHPAAGGVVDQIKNVSRSGKATPDSPSFTPGRATCLPHPTHAHAHPCYGRSGLLIACSYSLRPSFVAFIMAVIL